MSVIAPTLQKQLLSLILQKEDVLQNHRHSFTPDFFDNHIPKQLAELGFTFYDNYGGAPNRASMMSMLEMMLIEKEKEEVHRDEYLSTIDMLYDPLCEPDVQYLNGNLSSLMSSRKMQLAFLGALDLTAESKFQEAADLMADAAHFSLQPQDPFINLGEFDRYTYVEQALVAPIPTGFSGLDIEMHGGIRPGDLGIICGLSGRGKSQFLHNFAVNALRCGKTFLYLTMEMSAAQIIQRIDACLTNSDFHEITEEEANRRMRRTLENIRAEYPNFDQCFIIHKNNAEITVPETKALIKRRFGSEIPDLILVDYADLFKPTITYGSMYEDCGLIFAQLFNLSHSLDRAVWTATQANRQASVVKIVDIHHMAESFKKAFVADTVYTINQDLQERERNLLRLYSAKQRSHQGGRIHHFLTLFDRSQLVYKSESDYMTMLSEERRADLSTQVSSPGFQKNLVNHLRLPGRVA